MGEDWKYQTNVYLGHLQEVAPAGSHLGLAAAELRGAGASYVGDEETTEGGDKSSR